MSTRATAIPDWRNAYKQLLTARVFGDKTVLLPVAGIRTDGRSDYSRFFPRDFFTAIELFPDDIVVPALEDALLFLAVHQGTKRDPFTGEKPGAVPHEIPGVTLGRKHPHNTLFAAFDTTPLYIIAAKEYLDRGGKPEVIEAILPNLEAALGYIRNHMRNYIYWEDPAHCGATAYALKATHWRDGGIAGRHGRNHRYPVAYLITQAMAVAAFRALAFFSQRGLFPGDPDMLHFEAEKTKEALWNIFWHPMKAMRPAVAVDALGPVVLTQTDPIVALWYLEDSDVPYGYRVACEQILNELATPWGFQTDSCDPTLPGGAGIRKSIWPWEQCYIAEIARKFNFRIDLNPVVALSNVLSYCGAPFTEFVPLRWGHPHRRPSDCCDIQLWTVAYWSWYEKIAHKS